MNSKLKLLPFFGLYLGIVLLHLWEPLQGDEGRYVKYATNLAHGYYSSPGQIVLLSGPGYPFVLLPFAWLKLPWPLARLANPLFLFLAVLYFFQTLRLYLDEKSAFYFGALFGIYPMFLKYLNFLYTETFALLLVCGFLYHFCHAFAQQVKSWRHAFLASCYLGFLALTKVVFGYVILVGILFFMALYLWRRSYFLKKTFMVCALALLFCVPYLAYTYALTGRIFYWAVYSGSNFYWMTSPFEEELGDWGGGGVGHLQASGNPQLIEHHGKFFEALAHSGPVEWDERLKRKALSNIYHYPVKFMKNWICNVGRMLFNYPYSYTPQRMGTLFNIFSVMFIPVFAILSIYPSYVGRSRIPPEIFSILFLGLVAFAGSSLLAAYERQFRILVPFFILWIFVTLKKAVQIEILR